MEISRREFLKYLGITTAGVSLTGLGCDSIWSVPDEMYEKIGGLPGIETWKTSVCSFCPGGCGIKVRLIDGIPVRVNGNPIHPVNRGGICPMAEAGVEALFNPDRLKGPLMRLGERGGNKWESISWDEAIRIVVSRLQKLSGQNESHKLTFLSGHKNNLVADLIDRFMSSYGSPNVTHYDEAHLSALSTYITQGHKNTIGCDFKDVKLLLNFGADLLDAGPSPIRFNQLYSELRNPESGDSAKIVHIGSRFSRTASNSTEWIPIRPGTMAALALAMANVLIKDEQYDKDFIKNDSFGFADSQDEHGDVRQGFQTLVRREYSPEKASEITGIPAAWIVELAREFGAEKSALVLAGGDAANSSNGLYTLWAVECLNALKGNYKSNGPFSLQKDPPFAALSRLPRTAATKHARTNQGGNGFCFSAHAAASLPQTIVNTVNTIDTLMLANMNPVFSSVTPTRFADALNKIPFIVSFASCIDETSVYADLIMPDHVFLEKNEAVYNVPTVGFSHVGMQQQVVEPLHDTRHVGDVLLQMSSGMGGAVSKALNWPDYLTYLKYRLEGIYKTGAGTIFTEDVDEARMKSPKERGRKLLNYTTFNKFWDALLEKGGWWDPFPEKTNFRAIYKTPSKKFEFYSQILKQEITAQVSEKSDLELNSLLLKWKISERGDVVYLPHFEPPQYENDDSQSSLHLLTYPLITNINGSGSNLPLVQELFGLLTRQYWRSWIELNPETANHYKINDGDSVKITSKAGSLIVKAKIHPGVMPEVIQIPFGLGHKSYGRYANGIGVNPYDILSEEYDFLSGGSSLISTKVIIRKVSEKERV